MKLMFEGMEDYPGSFDFEMEPFQLEPDIDLNRVPKRTHPRISIDDPQLRTSQPRWWLMAPQVPIGSHSLCLIIRTKEAKLTDWHISRLMGFLGKVEKLDIDVRNAMRIDFEEIPELTSFLIPEVVMRFGTSEFKALFGSRNKTKRLGAEEFVRALTFFKVTYTIAKGGQVDCFEMSYSFFLPSVTEARRGPLVADPGTGYQDLTPYAVTAELTLDGRIVDLRAKMGDGDFFTED